MRIAFWLAPAPVAGAMFCLTTDCADFHGFLKEILHISCLVPNRAPPVKDGYFMIRIALAGLFSIKIVRKKIRFGKCEIQKYGVFRVFFIRFFGRTSFLAQNQRGVNHYA